MASIIQGRQQSSFILYFIILTEHILCILFYYSYWTLIVIASVFTADGILISSYTLAKRGFNFIRLREATASYETNFCRRMKDHIIEKLVISYWVFTDSLISTVWYHLQTIYFITSEFILVIKRIVDNNEIIKYS